MQEILLVLLCYILGSIPFSYIFSRVLGGVDIRSKGTGNVGATNVLRTLGIKIAVFALLGDLTKGAGAAWLGLQFGGPNLAAACATMAVIGHCWPIFLGFKGGKGIATSAGALMVLMPPIGFIALANFIIIIAISRYVSLGSITTAVILPILVVLTNQPWQYVVMVFVMAITAIYRHRTNIERLRQGTEKKINEKAT